MQQREKLQSLLLYPAIILGLLFFLMIALKIWLAPEIAQFSVSTTGKDPFSYLNFVKLGGLVLLSLLSLGGLYFFYWWKKQIKYRGGTVGIAAYRSLVAYIVNIIVII